VALNSIDIHLNAFANFNPVYAEVTKLKAAMADMQNSSFGSTLTTDYVSNLQNAQSQFNSLVSSTRAFNVQSVQMADSVQRFSAQLQSGQLKLGQYFSMWRQGTHGVATDLDNLATQQARVARSTVIPDTLHAGYAQVITDLNGTVTATEKAAFYQSAYNTVLRDGANKLIDFGKNMQWAGRQMTVGLTVPLALFASQASQAYLAFDKQMTDMLKVYGAHAVVQSQATLDAIKGQVTELASTLAHTLGIAMTDTAAIAATFSQIGLEGQDLINSTKATAELMKLGNLTATNAAQSMVAIQNVFKLSGSQAMDAVNFLNAAKHSTSTSMQDIIDAIPRVGPILQQMGGTYKDFVTLLVGMRESGVPAAQAANAIKSMMASLINPTTKAVDTFNNLGISLRSIVAKDSKNPLKMIEDLQQGLDKLPSTARTQAIEQLFGKFQFARVEALLNNLGQKGSQTEKVLELYNQSNEQLAAVAQQELTVATKGTPAAAFATMKASLQADLMPLGQGFLQLMTKIGNVVDTIVKGFNHLGALKGVILGALGFAALIGPLVMFVGLMSNLIGNVFKGVNYLRMFKEGFNQATDVGLVGRFNAGLQNMSNFYKEIDVNVLAAAHSQDLMTLSVENSAKAFDILKIAVQNLTTQIASLNATTAIGGISGTASVMTEAGVAAKTLTAGEAMQMLLPLGLATGGTVPGSGNGDTIPAMLTPGEFVMSKSAASKYRPVLDAMNKGSLRGYNAAGEVTEEKSGSVSSSGGYVFAHGMDNKPLSQYEFQQLKGLFAGIANPKGLARRMQDATSATGLSNYGFILPESANQGKMSPANLAAEFSGENISRTMAPIYHAYAQQLGMTLKEALANPQIAEQMHNDIRRFAEKISVEIGSLTTKAVSDPQFYEALKTAELELSNGFSKTLQNAVKDSKGTYTLGIFGGDVNRGTRGERQTIAEKETTARDILGLKQGVKSYKDVGTQAYREMGQAIQESFAGLAQSATALAEGSMSALKIASPSVAMEEIGKNAGLGAIQGLEATIPEAKVAGEKIGGTIAMSAEQMALPGMGNIGGATALEGELAAGEVGLAKSGFLSKMMGGLKGIAKSPVKMGTAALVVQMALPVVESAIPNKIGGVNTQPGKNIVSSVAGDAATGAMIGSFIPGVGTAVGAAVGGLFGLFKSVKHEVDQHTQDVNNNIKKTFAEQMTSIQKGAKDYNDALVGQLNYAASQVKPNLVTTGQGFRGLGQNLQTTDKNQTATNYKDLTQQAKDLSDTLAGQFQILTQSTGTIEQYNTEMQALKKSTADTTGTAHAFSLAIKANGDPAAKAALASIEKQAGSAKLTTDQLMSSLIAVMQGADAASLLKDPSKLQDAIKQFYAGLAQNQNNPDYKDPAVVAQQAQAAAAQKLSKYYTDLMKPYQGIKSLIEAQAAAQKKYNDQLKETQDYQSKQMSYFNQMKQATISGDYLGAAQAKQSASFTQAQFAATMAGNATSDQLAAVNNIIAQLTNEKDSNTPASKNKIKALTSTQTKSFLGGLSTTDYAALTADITRQNSANVGLAQGLASGSPFQGTQVSQTFNFQGALITNPTDFTNQVSAQAAQAVSAAAAKAAAKGGGSHKVIVKPKSTARVVRT